MKKFAACFAVAAALAAAVAALPAWTAEAVADEYTVEGGRLTYTFDDAAQLNDFDLYSQFGHDIYVSEGKAWSFVFGEQKMLLKEKQFGELDARVDIECINTHGKFNSGIYFGASDPTDARDGITAWAVIIERAANKETFDLKLHRFEYGVWKGSYASQTDNPVYSDVLQLRVVVKAGVVSAFIDGDLLLTFDVGDAEGMVGLRNYYSPNRFDNFSVSGEPLPVDFAEMNALKAKAAARAEENVTAEGKEALRLALALAEAATTQTEADDAAEALRAALDLALDAHTAEELTALIGRAEAITNPEGGVYTANSWEALQKVLAIAQGKLSASEQELSYWYLRLDMRVKNLIAYGRAAQ